MQAHSISNMTDSFRIVTVDSAMRIAERNGLTLRNAIRLMEWRLKMLSYKKQMVAKSKFSEDRASSSQRVF